MSGSVPHWVYLPSGTEIIKRLIRKEWVEETRDCTDKRKVFFTINNRGKATLFTSLGQLCNVSRVLSGNLETVEKQQLLRILKNWNPTITSSSYQIRISPWMNWLGSLNLKFLLNRYWFCKTSISNQLYLC